MFNGLSRLRVSGSKRQAASRTSQALIAIGRFKQEHAAFRSKLDILESSLRRGAEAWFVMRETSFSLAKQLERHIQDETGLVVFCSSTLNKFGWAELARFAAEHHDEREYLRLINRLFSEYPGRSLDGATFLFTEFIEGLRRRMDEQEAELYPLIERVTETRKTLHRYEPETLVGLTGAIATGHA